MEVYKLTLKTISIFIIKCILNFALIIVSTALIFNCLNVIIIKNIIGSNGIGNQTHVVILFLLLLIICLISFYCNAYFLVRKTDKLVKSKLINASEKKLFDYLLIKNFIIEITGFAIGFVIGIKMQPIILNFVYRIIGTNGDISSLNNVSVSTSIAVLIIQLYCTIVYEKGIILINKAKPLIKDNVVYTKNVTKIYKQIIRTKKFDPLSAFAGLGISVGNKEIKIKDKKKSVQFKALDKVSLSIKSGEFVCIMGPSGSGKSTFLNILSTIDMPNVGIVKVNGEDVPVMPQKKLSRFRYENIGYVFQDFNLLEQLTIRENISVPLKLADIPINIIDEKVVELAEKLNITNILDKFPYDCSGGEKQRAACARALVTEPRIIVADEPTGNLDTKNSHEILSILRERNEKDGISILMVTHDALLASYSKKLIFLRDGKIDEVVERGQLSQKEFYYKIVDITSKESQSLFDAM